MDGSIRDRLRNPRPILLDGATGTELVRRGCRLDAPEWTAAALYGPGGEAGRVLLHEIHADYVAAGAEIITANTFRTHARSLRTVGMDSRAGELTRVAVNVARLAADGKAWVAGSQSPLEDCYRPDRTPPIAELEREHALMAEQLAAAGVDLILVETHNRLVELQAACRAASRVGLPFLASVVCGADGRLLSGESLSAAMSAVLPLEPAGLLVNCLPVAAVPGALDELRTIDPERPVGAYANSGLREADGEWRTTGYESPAAYAQAATAWLERSARFIGGCCGTSPAHIAAVKSRLDRLLSPESV